MNLLQRFLLPGFILIFIIISLYTLDLNPLPWFDETYFASIARQFQLHGNFLAPTALHARNGVETLTYGPVYFFLTSTVFKLFSFGVFQFRIISFLSGILVCFVTILIARKWNNNKLVLLFLPLILLDPFLNLSIHEGRMDLTAVLLSLLSLYFVRETNEKKILLSGTFASLAILTTPRALIIVGVLMIYIIQDHVRKKKFTDLLLWFSPVLILNFLWILYAFGSPMQWYRYYNNLYHGVNAANHAYLGGQFYIPKHQYLLIIVTGLLLLISILKRRILIFDFLTLLSLSIIVLFYLIILDWGPYSAFIIPFYYLLIIHLFCSNFFELKWGSFPVIILAAFNIIFFAAKSVQIIADKEIREPLIADEFIKKNIPKGSKVLGDGTHYYSVIKAGSDYQFYHQYDSLESREKKHREDYQYEYLIVSAKQSDPESLKYYFTKGYLYEVAELTLKPSRMATFISKLGLSDSERYGYSCKIYKRWKKPDLPKDFVTLRQ